MQSSEDTPPDWRPYIRPPSAKDMEYIRHTWLSSYRSSPWAGVVPNNLYEHVYGETIDQLILRGMKFVVVANPADPSFLLAWLAYEESTDDSVSPPRRGYVIHYMFTKPTYRRLGCISQTLAHLGIDRFFFTFRTQSSKYLKGGTFRPEIARRREWTPPRDKSILQ